MYILKGPFREAAQFIANANIHILDCDFTDDVGPLEVYRRLSRDEMRQLVQGAQKPHGPRLKTAILAYERLDLRALFESHGIQGWASRVTEHDIKFELHWKDGPPVLPSKIAAFQDEIRALTMYPCTVVDHLPIDWDDFIRRSETRG